MGLSNYAEDDEEQKQDSEAEEKVSYLYVRSNENKEAYDAMSNGLGGDAAVRDFLKNDLPNEVCEDQHDFFQQIIVHLRDVIENDDYTGLLEYLMVDEGNIARFLDQNDEVREAFMELVESHEAAQENDEEETEEEPTPADD